MCGITGIYNIGGEAVDKQVLESMTRIIAHRGPDDEGFYFNKNMALGHRRLSIIDLSLSGHQPMSTDDGRFTIVYNGEVYNYPDIKLQLQKLGYKFHSTTDTEVILYSFIEWGRECLQRFNGMWSFAIWDNQKEQLFCARDRFGVKPFYYYFDGSTFIFASEIKALLQHPSVTIKPNDYAIYKYLMGASNQNIEQTFFHNIYQLPQGNHITVNRDGMKIEQFYKLRFNTEMGRFDAITLREHSQDFIQLLRDCIEIRLRSDVPVGSCLSGGLDSSTIVCIINEILRREGYSNQSVGDRQKTFSSCYEIQQYDERPHIEEVIRKTNAASYYVFPSGDRLWEELDDLIWHQEEPFGSTSIYTQWNVMRLAKQNNVKVLLDGQGADELLGGYKYYYVNYFNQLLYSGLFTTLIYELNAQRKNSGSNIYSLLFLLAPLYNILPISLLNIGTGKILKKRDFSIIKGDFRKKYANTSRHSISLNLQKALWQSETVSGLRELLRYEDKNSMAFSLETRTPFVDYRLVEFVFSLPACYKIHDGWTKYLLREGTKSILPESVRLRKDKLGFPAPEKIWMNNGKQKIMSIFSNKDFRSGDYIEPAKFINNFDSMLSSPFSGAFTPVWAFINLELWLQRMFK